MPTTALPHRRDTERPAGRRSAHSAHPKSRLGYVCWVTRIARELRLPKTNQVHHEKDKIKRGGSPAAGRRPSWLWFHAEKQAPLKPPLLPTNRLDTIETRGRWQRATKLRYRELREFISNRPIPMGSTSWGHGLGDIDMGI